MQEELAPAEPRAGLPRRAAGVRAPPRARSRSSRWRPARRSASAPASASSTACWAAAWCRARSCSSGAIPASASPRSCSPRSKARRRAGKRPVLYVSGEESARQVKCGPTGSASPRANLLVLAETDAEKVLHAAEQLSPAALAVDSIQTSTCPSSRARRGRITQVREVAGAAHGVRQDDRGARLPRRPRHEGRRHRRAARARAHGGHGPLLRGRAAATRTACSAPTRTASAPRTRSACSR